MAPQNEVERDIVELLFSERRLDRDRGESKLEAYNQDPTQLLNHLVEMLQNSGDDVPWAIDHGCLLGVKGILSKDRETSPDMLEVIRQVTVQRLSHAEVRVRTVAGELLGVLCQLTHGDAYRRTKQALIDLLSHDLERQVADDDDIKHQSVGWRHLETSMKCLQQMINKCGDSFRIEQKLMQLMLKTLEHENRFVRETGFYVSAELFATPVRIAENAIVTEMSNTVAQYIAKGLADNWSQVRLASSKAARNFLVNSEQPQKHYDELVPRLCLNRYYIADGVRIYTQNTWKEIFGEAGKKVVEEHIDAIVKYYIHATQANNHAVREAACHCIAELAIKVDPHSTKRYADELIEALLDCFKDDSWPVRDAACVSCGNLLIEFHQQVKAHQQTLYKLFLANLEDPIPSVRAGAAISIGKYVKVYGDEELDTVVNQLREGFDYIKTQPEDSENFVGLNKKPAVFGVVKNVAINDANHTDQIMYSCGSLAPKMGRNKLGGCTDCHFQRASKPWERSDGCVYLLVELARFYPAAATELIPNLVQATTFKHFPQHQVFHETVCKQLPILATLVGKRIFKQQLDQLLPVIFYAVASDVPLTSVAGEQCLQQLAKFVGSGILRGRIEMWNSEKLADYDRFVNTNVQF